MGKIDPIQVDPPIVISPLELHLDYSTGVSPLDPHLDHVAHVASTGRTEGKIGSDGVAWHDPDGLFDSDAMLAQGWKRLDGDWWVFQPSVAA